MEDRQSKNQEGIQTRPPVVVVLGHVDHGKSSLIEKIKQIKITERESGGITQHIGAYEVEHDSKKITFIDTPGHEAFSAMRARGSHFADIAILVVAADEGIKPQTKEAIDHIAKAGIPSIVALNKIDKSEANIQKTIGELAKAGVATEQMGGQIPAVEISAKTGQGLDDLLSMILLVAELTGLQDTRMEATEAAVIEASLDPLRGPTATLLVQSGILAVGDIVATPTTFGKVKTLENFQKKSIAKALPSTPVIVTGFEEVPHLGEICKTFSSKEEVQQYLKKQELRHKPTTFVQIQEGQKVLNLILKADVEGSLEAVQEIIKILPQEKVVVRTATASVGDVTESDVKLAQSAKAAILAFRVSTQPQVASFAERSGVMIVSVEIIYEFVQKVRELMELLLAPEIIRKDIAKVQILAIFRVAPERQIVGGRVLEGELVRGVKLEVIGNGEVLGTGRLTQLQREKKDVSRVPQGEECGILFEGTTKIKEGDELVAYIEEKRKQLL